MGIFLIFIKLRYYGKFFAHIFVLKAGCQRIIPTFERQSYKIKHMIKRFFQWLKRKAEKAEVIQHITLPEPMSSTEAAVIRYFKSSSASVFALPYSPLYQDAVSGLRVKGWNIPLSISDKGELFYQVYRMTSEWLTENDSPKKIM